MFNSTTTMNNNNLNLFSYVSKENTKLDFSLFSELSSTTFKEFFVSTIYKNEYIEYINSLNNFETLTNNTVWWNINWFYTYNSLISLLFLITIIFCIGLFIPKTPKGISTLNILSAFIILLFLIFLPIPHYNVVKTLLWFDYNLYVYIYILISGIFTLSFLAINNEVNFLKENKHIEYPLLILLIFLSGIVVVASENFIAVFLALEAITLASAVLIGLQRTNNLSTLAGVRYIFFSAIPGGALILGIVEIYNYTGSFNFSDIEKLLINYNLDNTNTILQDFNLINNTIYTLLINTLINNWDLKFQFYSLILVKEFNNTLSSDSTLFNNLIQQGVSSNNINQIINYEFSNQNNTINNLDTILNNLCKVTNSTAVNGKYYIYKYIDTYLYQFITTQESLNWNKIYDLISLSQNNFISQELDMFIKMEDYKNSNNLQKIINYVTYDNLDYIYNNYYRSSIPFVDIIGDYKFYRLAQVQILNSFKDLIFNDDALLGSANKFNIMLNSNIYYWNLPAIANILIDILKDLNETDKLLFLQKISKIQNILITNELKFLNNYNQYILNVQNNVYSLEYLNTLSKDLLNTNVSISKFLLLSEEYDAVQNYLNNPIEFKNLRFDHFLTKELINLYNNKLTLLNLIDTYDKGTISQENATLFINYIFQLYDLDGNSTVDIFIKESRQKDPSFNVFTLSKYYRYPCFSCMDQLNYNYFSEGVNKMNFLLDIIPIDFYINNNYFIDDFIQNYTLKDNINNLIVKNITFNLNNNVLQNLYLFIENTDLNYLTNNKTFFIIENNHVNSIPLIISVSLFLIIFYILFKLTAAPFHIWAPSIYEGAPLPIAMFLSIFSKITMVFLLIKLLLFYFYFLYNEWSYLLLFSGILSILVGIYGAIAETRIKRFFIYSSMGHVGFMLLGIAAGGVHGAVATIIYLVIYVITVFIGWSALFASLNKITHINQLKGLSKTNPTLSFIIAISMLSMSGIPPLAGFFVKFEILYALVESEFYAITLLVLLLTVFSFFYYLRIIKILYFEPIKSHKNQFNLNKIQSFLFAICFLLLINFSIYCQQPIEHYIKSIIIQSLS